DRNRDWRKVLDRIEWQLVEHKRIAGMRTIGQQNGIAIGRRLGGLCGANVAARARHILHIELLPKPFGKLLQDGTRDDVGRTARRKWNDDAYRSCRIILRPSR